MTCKLARAPREALSRADEEDSEITNKEIRTVILDLVGMLTIYAKGRDNSETRGQALSTIRDGITLLSKYGLKTGGLIDDLHK